LSGRQSAEKNDFLSKAGRGGLKNDSGMVQRVQAATVMLRKFNITVACEHCRLASSDDKGGFAVIVPVNDIQSAIFFQATLSCTVSPQAHRVSVRQVVDCGGAVVDLPAETQARVAAMLNHVAEKRVCGNRSVCPSAVVGVVNRQAVADTEAD
jgi:hypothetical protein